MTKEPSIKIEGLRRLTWENIKKEIFENKRPERIEKLKNPKVLQFLEEIGKLEEVSIWNHGKSETRLNIPLALADSVYEGSFSIHNAYWNDRFYIAQKFNLDEFKKRTSAIVLLWNGENNYFEWITHFGFDNARLFRELNLITPDEENSFRESYKKQRGIYTSITRSLSGKVAEKFRITNEEIKHAYLISEVVGKKMGIYH